MIEKIPLTVENIQYNLDQIDVNSKSTPASKIAFRATNIRKTSLPFKYEQGEFCSVHQNGPYYSYYYYLVLFIFFILIISKLFLVSWKNIDYNDGGHFDGSIFTAPVEGIYSFLAIYTTIAFGFSGYKDLKCYVNDDLIAKSSSVDRPGVPLMQPPDGMQCLHAVVQLNKNDKVKLEGKMYIAGKPTVNAPDTILSVYEGRLALSALEKNKLT